MKKLSARLDQLDWSAVNNEILQKGFVIIKNILNVDERKNLIEQFTEDSLYRSTIDMKRYNFGRGRYRYFKYPLPDLIQQLRSSIYEKIVDSANTWSERTKYKIQYPKNYQEFTELMKSQGQTKSTPLILRYEKDDYNCLHQDISNDLIFPYQLVFGLSEKDRDYQGGQLILTQQRPRMQTIPYIITIPPGGAVIFSSNFHPQQGKRGFYRSIFRHGVGQIEAGERYTLGLVFHDYKES